MLFVAGKNMNTVQYVLFIYLGGEWRKSVLGKRYLMRGCLWVLHPLWMEYNSKECRLYIWSVLRSIALNLVICSNCQFDRPKPVNQKMGQSFVCSSCCLLVWQRTHSSRERYSFYKALNWECLNDLHTVKKTKKAQHFVIQATLALGINSDAKLWPCRQKALYNERDHVCMM